MLEKLVYLLMAWEAMQHPNFTAAYINATGGGIIRSAMLGIWSSNMSAETVFSIWFWNVVANLVRKYNILPKIRAKVKSIKSFVNSIASVVFGVYGLIAAPQLKWFGYFVTACGGGITYCELRSRNIFRTSLEALVRNCWTLIEGILISIFGNRTIQIVLAAFFIIVRVIYLCTNGRNLTELVIELKHYHMPTVLGIPAYLWCQCPVFMKIGNVISVIRRKGIAPLGSLCRRMVNIKY